jgi:tRNA threonylcarbamoyladenosine biosynthesis protein TsaE
MQAFTKTTHSVEETQLLGEFIGSNLKGGEVFELVSDLGGGKTTFVGGLARGFGSPDPVASPSFTISYVYTRPDKKTLHHYDFYRLQEAGVMAHELAEVEGDNNAVVAVEWGDIVHKLLPQDRITVKISVANDDARSFEFHFTDKYAYLFARSMESGEGVIK